MWYDSCEAEEICVMCVCVRERERKEKREEKIQDRLIEWKIENGILKNMYISQGE